MVHYVFNDLKCDLEWYKHYIIWLKKIFCYIDISLLQVQIKHVKQS